MVGALSYGVNLPTALFVVGVLVLLVGIQKRFEMRRWSQVF